MALRPLKHTAQVSWSGGGSFSPDLILCYDESI